MPRPAKNEQHAKISERRNTSIYLCDVKPGCLLTGVGEADEAGAVEEAVPGVPPLGLVVGVHRHRRPRQQHAAVADGAASGALDRTAVALGAGEVQVGPQRSVVGGRLGDAPCLGRLQAAKKNT